MNLLVTKSKLEDVNEGLYQILKSLDESGHDVVFYAKEIIPGETAGKLSARGLKMASDEFNGIQDYQEPFDLTVSLDEFGETLPNRVKVEVENPTIQDVLRVIEGTPIIDNEAIEEEEIKTEKKISVVIPVFNNLEYTMRCIDSMAMNTMLKFELVIIDNGSTDETSEYLKILPMRGIAAIEKLKVITNNTNLGFIKAFNQGVKAAKGDYLVGFNNDVLVAKGWLEKLVETADDGNGDIIAIRGNVGCNVQHVDVEEATLIGMNDKLLRENKKEVEETVAVPFSLCLIKKSVFKEIGYLSEDFGIGYGDDGDFCLRAGKAGFKVTVRKDGCFYHFGKATFNLLYTPEEIKKIKEKNTDILKNKHPEHYGVEKKEETETIEKPIKNILVATNHLANIGGTETFTLALVKELVDRGYVVDVCSAAIGEFAEHFEELGIEVRLKPSREKYDRIFINHNTMMNKLKDVEGKKIMTCHGVFPQLEQPIEGADKYVAISKEVQDHLKKEGFESTIIHNGVDLDRFKPENKIGKKIKSVLLMTHGQPATTVARNVCEKMKLKVYDVTQRTFNIEDKINKVDLVIGLGRSAIEAMACGRNVIAFDHRHYVKKNLGDGMIHANNIKKTLEYNLSGRATKKHFEEKMLEKEIKKYSQKRGDWARKYAEDHFDIKKAVDKYLKI